MLIGSIYGWEFGKDDLFDPRSQRNRDDCLEPFRVLRNYASLNGVELHTCDMLKEKGLAADFNLYVESIPVDVLAKGKNYLILFETPLTVPINADPEYLNLFDGIFTWDLNLLERLDLRGFDHRKFKEIRIPNPVPEEFWDEFEFGYSTRPNFCCLIGSNRHANSADSRELYSERVKAIRWFEKNALDQFYLYGNGWTVPQKRFGRMGKLIYRLQKILPLISNRFNFPSYQGPVQKKRSVLAKTRFCICFENARDIRGYLTEKIFDSLLAGCIPIYWGEPNIDEYIPQACYIDFRKFQSYEALYQYLTNMTEIEFIGMQRAGREFIKSDSFLIHGSQMFAQKIINEITGVLSN
ncbi:glycosyltransferase family 10 domain-containing protein [Polynucleobacter brandtiae]|uniref:Glycosyl transferase family 10 (Putative fucosyltransferase) n=1 Tax=Polynucleobacter brandtiae TaxID=1938816 RepID=A0A2M8VR71_9BURK|nr:glycosyltransferase family 10 [Polynucleobacter brandtiae]PJI79937.1 glycosyl transferase family 10 (putative fucosyltransferase) [Polynucleobacter brandtiae]